MADRGPLSGQGLLFPAVVICLLLLLTGWLLLRLRAHVRAREQGIRQAQRLEYARDLHDFVAHHVTAIVAQTKAVRYVTEAGRGQDPAQLDQMLAAIEGAGSQALDSMRSMVSVLRERAPARMGQDGHPDLAGLLSEMAAEFSAAGPRTTVTVDPRLDGRSLAPRTAEAVHRMVLESLTNVRKHAVAATAVTVTVRLVPGPPERLEVSVTDDGRARDGDAPGTFPTSGFGLRGLAERVVGIGGTVTAGPGAGGGWQVRTLLPLHPADLPGRSPVHPAAAVDHHPVQPSPRVLPEVHVSSDSPDFDSRDSSIVSASGRFASVFAARSRTRLPEMLGDRRFRAAVVGVPLAVGVVLFAAAGLSRIDPGSDDEPVSAAAPTPSAWTGPPVLPTATSVQAERAGKRRSEQPARPRNSPGSSTASAPSHAPAGSGRSAPASPSSAPVQRTAAPAKGTAKSPTSRSPSVQATTYTYTQAENYSSAYGVRTESTGDTGAGVHVGSLSDEDWVRYEGLDFGTRAVDSMIVRLASGAPAVSGATGYVKVYLDDPKQPPIAVFSVPHTGGWQSWKSYRIDIPPTSGRHMLKFKFFGYQDQDVANFNWFALEHG